MSKPLIHASQSTCYAFNSFIFHVPVHLGSKCWLTTTTVDFLHLFLKSTQRNLLKKAARILSMSMWTCLRSTCNAITVGPWKGVSSGQVSSSTKSNNRVNIIGQVDGHQVFPWQQVSLYHDKGWRRYRAMFLPKCTTLPVWTSDTSEIFTFTDVFRGFSFVWKTPIFYFAMNELTKPTG